MQGASRDAFAAGSDRLDALAASAGTDAGVLADELFAVVRVLDSAVALRRVLTDPARPGQAKADVVAGLFGGKVGEATADLLAGLVRARWSASGDLPDAVEALAVRAEVIRAEQLGELDELEDEIFRFGRIVANEPGLRAVLVDQTAPVASRAGLIRDLLSGRVTATASRLLPRVVTDARGRSIDGVLAVYARTAAERRSRMVAVVTAAAPLTVEQRSRLGAALRRIYGHEVHLNVEVDPTVVGGLRVRVGDEIIDGTVAERLDGARRRLAG